LVTAAGAGKNASVDIAVVPDTGPELVAGSTRLKAGTATKLVLNAVSTAAMIALGKVYRGRMIDLRASNAKLKARAVRMVSELTALAPADARRLLRLAGGRPRIAVAMHLSQTSRTRAERLLKQRTLRELETR
jgi:N-acetylmuramic acid 6-phosphate etherase